MLAKEASLKNVQFIIFLAPRFGLMVHKIEETWIIRLEHSSTKALKIKEDKARIKKSALHFYAARWLAQITIARKNPFVFVI